MTQKSPLKDTRVVGTSFLVSISDVLINAVMAVITGSVVMLSQALQGLSDLITTGLLYRGVKASRRRRDEKHQFGYGREIFFWVIIAGVFMFFGTGILSVFFGARQILNPQPLVEMRLAFMVLVISLVANAYAFSLSFRRLKQYHSGTISWWRSAIHSSLIETKSTFLIDALGTIAALTGMIALGAFLVTGNSQFDGMGGVVIGLMMMIGSVLIIFDVKALIVGKAVSPDVAHKIIVAATHNKHVESVLDLRTAYIGSDRLLVILELHLENGLTTDIIELVSDEVKAAVRSTVPQAAIVQIEIETPDEELEQRLNSKADQ